jgi:hypothetical protein
MHTHTHTQKKLTSGRSLLVGATRVYHSSFVRKSVILVGQGLQRAASSTRGGEIGPSHTQGPQKAKSWVSASRPDPFLAFLFPVFVLLLFVCSPAICTPRDIYIFPHLLSHLSTAAPPAAAPGSAAAPAPPPPLGATAAQGWKSPLHDPPRLPCWPRPGQWPTIWGIWGTWEERRAPPWASSTATATPPTPQQHASCSRRHHHRRRPRLPIVLPVLLALLPADRHWPRAPALAPAASAGTPACTPRPAPGRRGAGPPHRGAWRRRTATTARPWAGPALLPPPPLLLLPLPPLAPSCGRRRRCCCRRRKACCASSACSPGNGPDFVPLLGSWGQNQNNRGASLGLRYPHATDQSIGRSIGRSRSAHTTTSAIEGLTPSPSNTRW